tara:strand:+ start:662 stop:940 length:279 start_codon:yes stop_codon:yes gene_type:complete
MGRIHDIKDKFSWEKMQILVEYMTDSGSAFAITPEGDQVFLNARLVSRMDVRQGDIFDANLILNYPDKREITKWRAIRVEDPTRIPEVFQDA